MNFIIRKLTKSEYPLLRDFLYEAIFIPEGVEPPEKSIIDQPELLLYIEDFGEKCDAHCLAAEVNGKVVGAVWARIMNDYGHIDDETPSLAISLYPEYRGLGIGTEMLRQMLRELKAAGYQKASLSVQKANYAVKLYLKTGFTILRETDEEYIMTVDLNQEKSCGAVVFTRMDDGEIRYVLVQQNSGRYCFPKGHMEGAETEHQTALREIWEETGLHPHILPGFRESEIYEVRKKPGTMKDVCYFLAEYDGQPADPPASEEIHEVQHCSYQEALELLPTESRKEILRKANSLLTGENNVSIQNEAPGRLTAAAQPARVTGHRVASLRCSEQIQNNLLIRTATINDLDAVTAVEAECFPPAEAATREEFAERLKIYGNHFWLMFDGERLISFVDGFVTDEPDLRDEMFADESLHNENGAWQMIFGVNTIPSERGKGYAGQLIERAIEDAKAQGRKGLVLTAKEAKVHYYAKFGFVSEGISKNSNHGGAEWYQMRLKF